MEVDLGKRMDLNKRWSLLKEQLCKELKPEQYEGWIDQVVLAEASIRKIIIAGIPHPLFRDDIASNYDGLFRRLLNEIFPEIAPVYKKRIKYCVGTYDVDQKDPVQTEFIFEESGDDFSSEELLISGSNPSGKKTRAKLAGKKVIPLQTSDFAALFNPKHSLDSLIVSEHNKLAYEAARHIIHAPGASYNPFYIYGELGLGKTHLLEAIGRAFFQLHPGSTVIYLTAESFLNDYVEHIQQKKMSNFRQRYRKMDMVLIDRVQFVSGAKYFQEELYHTIESLQKAGKQVVVTCNQLSRNIKEMNPSLSSLLESGLMAEITNPDLETRMAILRNRARRDYVKLPPEVCYFIARHITTNVRKMESALIRLGAHASLLGQKITLEFAKRNLSDLLETPLHEEQVDLILQKICTMSQVSRSDLKSAVRASHVVFARRMGMYLLKELTDLSLTEIGAQFGNRTHSAIHDSIKRIRKRMETDDVLRQQLQLLKEDLSRTCVKPMKIPRKTSEMKQHP